MCIGDKDMSCGHYFEKIGPVLKTWQQSPYTGEKEYSFIQEMECSKCGITTYYPVERPE